MSFWDYVFAGVWVAVLWLWMWLLLQITVIHPTDPEDSEHESSAIRSP